VINLESSALGQLIRRCRKAAGLSRSELAELAGVGKTVVFDIEHGKESVRLDTLRKVLGALDLELRVDGPCLSHLETVQ